VSSFGHHTFEKTVDKWASTPPQRRCRRHCFGLVQQTEYCGGTKIKDVKSCFRKARDQVFPVSFKGKTGCNWLNLQQRRLRESFLTMPVTEYCCMLFKEAMGAFGLCPGVLNSLFHKVQNKPEVLPV